ncbi:zinc finger, CCHC-type containing protein [Tanacetum coccineum]
MDSLDLDVSNRERTRLRLFQFSLRDQAINLLERLLAGSISTWEDLTTRFFAQFFPPGWTAKLRNDILMFQQYQGEPLSEAWTLLVPTTLSTAWKIPIKLFVEYASSRIDEAGEPEQTLEDEFKDLHLNLSVLEVLAHAPMYNAILDKYMESLELGKNGSASIQGEMPKKIEEFRLFTLPCRLGNSEPFDTLTDLGACVNIIPLYLFNWRKPTMSSVGRGFLAIANVVIDCRKSKIAVGEGITMSVFGVKGIELGQEEALY